MTASTTHASNVVTNWERKYFAEYTRNSRFSKFEGTGSNNVIVAREGNEQTVSIPFIGRLTGAGVSGSTALVGSEEALSNYAWTLTPTYERNAVTATKEETEKPNFDFLGAAREQLSIWAKTKHRDNILAAMGAIYDGTTYSTYAAAAEGAKDTYLANNDGAVNRVLFGDAIGNQSGTDHSASLLNVTAAMTLDAASVSLMKRMAQTAVPHITPLRTTDDEEFFILFVPSIMRRDLIGDTAFLQATREARERGLSNPLFKGGDLMWDNVLIREVPEIADIGTVGGTSARVAPCYLCGAEAVGHAYGQRPRMTRKVEDDYNFSMGVGVEHKEQVRKMYWNNVANGIVTGFFGAALDS